MIKLNGEIVKFDKFSNKETKLKLPYTYESNNRVLFVYEDDSSLIELMIFKRHLDSLLVKDVKLTISYMPYSRLDREECGLAFTLKYISEFINAMNFEQINVYEPHSDVCLATLNNATASYLTPELLYQANSIAFNKEKDFLFFPDAGAMKRYSKMFPDYKYLVGFKSRDFVSGNIEKLQILGNVTKGANVVIIDDLCSGGRTFSMSAEKLKEIGCGDIYLIVGHCENTIFEYGFLENKNIKHVFTTNSILKTQTHPKLSVLDVL